jgi:hypothetical protein
MGLPTFFLHAGGGASNTTLECDPHCAHLSGGFPNLLNSAGAESPAWWLLRPLMCSGELRLTADVGGHA